MLWAGGELHGRRKAASWTLAALLAILFLFQGGAKLLAAPFEVEAFERWGYPQWFRVVVGAMEAAAAFVVLVPRLRFLGAMGIMGIMVGAALTHIRAGEPHALPLPIGVLVLALVLAWIHRPRGLIT